jgi:hypothetical protein
VSESGFFGPLQDDTAIGVAIGSGESEAGSGGGAAGNAGDFEGGMDGLIEILHGQQRTDSALVGGSGGAGGEDLIGVVSGAEQRQCLCAATVDAQQE